MAKKKPFVVQTKEVDKTVGFGKYKEKLLLWVAKNDLDFFRQIEELYFEKYDKLKQIYYKKLHTQYVRDGGLMAKQRFEKEVVEAIELMKQKKSSKEITQHFMLKYNLSIDRVHVIMVDANLTLRKEFEIEKSFLLDIHLLRYEEIFLENLHVDLSEVPVGYRKAIQCEHYISAMETLFQKEKLLGVHTKNFKLQVNNFSIQEANLEYDLTKLTSGERLEIFSLLEIAKKTEKFNKPFLQNNNPLDINITASVDVVNDIPVKKATQTDIIKDQENLIVESTGKTLFEVEEVIQNTLKDKVRELFEKKKK